MRRPLFALFAAFATGMVLARFFNPGLSVTFIFLLLSIGFLFTLIRRTHRPNDRLYAILLIIITALLGALRYTVTDHLLDRHSQQIGRLDEKGVSLTGVAGSHLERREGNRFRFILDQVTAFSEQGAQVLPMRFLVEGREESPPHIQPGDKVQIKARVSSVRSAMLPGGFDYREYLAARHVHGRGWVSDEIIKTADARLSAWHRFLRLAGRLRQHTLDSINHHLSPLPGALLQGMLLGQRHQMPDRMEKELVQSGLMHITAVSGLHVTALTVFLIWFLKTLGLKRRHAVLVIIPFLFLFLAATGFRPPTVRAVIMGWVLMFAWVVERDTDLLSSLSLAGLALLLYSPLYLFQAGFQMSFLAVLGLVILLPRWNDLLEVYWGRMYGLFNRSNDYIPKAARDERVPRIIRWVWIALGASVIAQLCVSPLVARYYLLWTPVAVLGNLIALPLVTLSVIGGMFHAIISWLLPFLADLSAWVLDGLLWILIRIVNLSGRLSWGHFYASVMHPVAVVAWYGALLFLAVDKRTQPKQEKQFFFGSRRSTALVVAILFFWLWVLWPEQRYLRLTFLSLGQGDSIFVEFPHGGNLLVDGGPRTESGRQANLIRFLRRKGVRRVDAVVNTHPQDDHIGHLPEVFGEFETGCLFHNGKLENLALAHQLIAAASREGCPRVALSLGESIEGFQEVDIDVLGPDPDYRKFEGLDPNLLSVVLWIRYGRFSCLLTGDIPSPVEDALARPDIVNHCTVLKVAHHGSDTSSSEYFLEHLRPQVAVIQCGRNNYGHPSLNTLRRLRQAGAVTYRTDRDGSVIVATDGRSCHVKTTAQASENRNSLHFALPLKEY